MHQTKCVCLSIYYIILYYIILYYIILYYIILYYIILYYIIRLAPNNINKSYKINLGLFEISKNLKR
jgi:hypothetical protein